MSQTLERRALADPVEFCQGGDTHGTIVGTAAVFNKETTIGGSWRERVAPDAFDAALRRPDDVRALFNHDPSQVLGRLKAGTLQLEATPHGLRYVIALPDTAVGRDVRTLIGRGDVTGSSFGFKVTGDKWDTSGVRLGRLPLRIITEVELCDVSPVTYPAYPQTSVSAARGTASPALARRRAARAAIAAARQWRVG